MTAAGRRCADKIAHPTKAAAVAHARALRRRGAVRVVAFWCSAHAAWHVGHRPVPRAKRRRY